MKASSRSLNYERDLYFKLGRAEGAAAERRRIRTLISGAIETLVSRWDYAEFPCDLSTPPLNDQIAAIKAIADAVGVKRRAATRAPRKTNKR